MEAPPLFLWLSIGHALQRRPIPGPTHSAGQLLHSLATYDFHDQLSVRINTLRGMQRFFCEDSCTVHMCAQTGARGWSTSLGPVHSTVQAPLA